MLTKQIKQIIMALVGGIVILTVGYFAWISFIFRVESVSPKSNEVITGTSSIDFYFNQPVQNNLSVDNVSSNQKIIQGVTLKSPKIVSVQVSGLQESTPYQIKLKNISSTSGQKINDYSYSFTARFIPFSDLSKEEQQRQIQKTDSGPQEDKVYEFLPYTSDHFRITAEDDNSSGIAVTTISIDLLLTEYELRDETTYLKTYKADALKFLQEKQVELTKYKLNYIQPEAAAL